MAEARSYRPGTPHPAAGFVFWAVLILALGPWLYIRAGQATNSDILWLCEALRRIFTGGTLSADAFETNPPLSLLVYTLPVLADMVLHIPLHITAFFQTVIMCAVSALALNRILSCWPVLGIWDVRVATAAYALAITVGASLYFGERDHLIILGLAPFVAGQISLTCGWRGAERWRMAAFICGAALILLKPHHGLLPTLLLAHRAWRQRRLSVVFDPDFLCLATAVLGYIALVFLAFPDYATVILPDVMALYVAMGSVESVLPMVLGISGVAVAAGIGAFLIKTPHAPRRVIAFFALATLISLVPYAVQGMGFYYHLIPALVFMAMALTLLLLAWIGSQTKGGALPGFLTLGMAIAVAFVFAPLNTGYPRHADMARNPVAAMLDDCADEPCSFFMFNKDMGIIHETAYYAGARHASRFPSLWFLAEMLNQETLLTAGRPARLTRDEIDRYRDAYAARLAQDFERDKPVIALIWRWDDAVFPGDLIDYFSPDPAFRAAWAPYRKTGQMDINYADFYPGARAQDKIIRYDVYRRAGP